MKYLLDTHILLWAAGDTDKLTDETKKIIQSDNNQLYYSVASIWEIVIKNGLGRQDFQVDVDILRRGLIDNGYNELPILSEHVAAINHLPQLHKDPFDRMLIAQAITEGIILLTADRIISQYQGPIKYL